LFWHKYSNKKPQPKLGLFHFAKKLTPVARPVFQHLLGHKPFLQQFGHQDNLFMLHCL